MFLSTGKAAAPHGSLVLSGGKWRAHSGFLLLPPSHAGLLWSGQDRSHPGEEGRECPLFQEAAVGTTLPLLPRGQLGQGTVVASALAGLGQGGGTRATVQQQLCPRGTHIPWGAPKPWVGHPLPRTNPSKPLLRGLVEWGQFTEQITEPGCEAAVSKS